MKVNSAIARCRGYLGGDQDNYTLTSGTLDASTGTITFQYPSHGAGRGSRIELRSDTAHEICYVWSTNADDTQLTVSRGWDGTTAAAWPNGTLVAIRPEVTDHEIFTAIEQEVLSLPAEGIYRRGSVEISYDSVEDGYDISGVTDAISFYAVEYHSGGYTHWVYDFKRDNDLLRLLSVQGNAGDTATLHYRRTLGAVASKDTDLESEVGIPASATDIVPLGAAVRVILNREAKRTQVQAQTHARDSEDVEPAANVRAAQLLMVARADRLRVERQRLREDWPMRIR